MTNQIVRVLEASEADVQYDENVKNILSNRYVLAWILKYTNTEFTELSINQIALECIGDAIEVARAPLLPEGKRKILKNLPDKITGENVESIIPGEGRITFDIRFSAYAPKKEEFLKILLNIEAQKAFYPGYSLVTRGIFYVARMISGQLDTEFSPPDYNGLKKSVSIWLAMNGPDYIGNAITEYTLQKHDIINEIPDIKEHYDKLSVILICLNRKNEDNGNQLTGLLNTLLSTEITVEEKKKTLAEKYEIETDNKLEKEMNLMCNLSQAIKEDGIKIGEARGREIGEARGRGIGESRVNSLNVRLAAQGRTEDIIRAASDTEYQKKLFEEFQL